MDKKEYKFKIDMNKGWWTSYLGEDLFFPYINHAGKLDAFIKGQKSLFDYVKIVGKRIRIDLILNYFIGINLIKAVFK